MGILIKQKITKETVFNPKYPSFYMRKDAKNYIAFYSEKKTVTVFTSDVLYQMGVSEDPNIFYGLNEYIEGSEISERCFNEILAKAMSMVPRVEVCPTLCLQD